MDRRAFLQATLVLAACGRAIAQAPARPLLPVQVDPARLSRTVVGLRPYRGPATGWRPRSSGPRRSSTTTATEEPVSRSPGAPWSGPERAYAVLGCGVMGLTTARLLQERGARVTIYARSERTRLEVNVPAQERILEGHTRLMGTLRA